MKSSFRIPVRLGPRRYEIRIGSGHLDDFGLLLRRMRCGTDPVLLSNATILSRYENALKSTLARGGFPFRVLTVADTERSKSLTTLGRVLVRLAELDGTGRRLFLILAGGGVVGDLGGVVAGLYRRGIPFVQLPTTLLAQVDSAIGGKTGIDLPQGKNLVGLFYQPSLVFVEMDFLQTLTLRQFRSGLAEALKCGIIRDPELFEVLERSDVETLRGNESGLSWIIARSVRVKTSLVEEDEREARGIRTLLNFGHTLGHAVETASRYTRAYTHGEAVALGMLTATELSRRLGLISVSAGQRIHRAVARLGFPQVIRGLEPKQILQAMAHDKKWILGRNRWVLPTGIGRCTVQQGVPDSMVQAAVVHLLGD